MYMKINVLNNEYMKVYRRDVIFILRRYIHLISHHISVLAKMYLIYI